MKFLVFMWAVFQMFSFSASDTNSSYETYNLITSTNLAKPGCESRCGNLIVPYPFGISTSSNCSLDKGFVIHCNTSSNPPKATIGRDDYSSITRISDSTLRISNLVATTCYFQNGTISRSNSISAKYTLGPYTFSQLNKFTVIGCDDYAWLTSTTKSRIVSTGCMAFCSKPEEVVGGECSGNGCCQSSIPQDINFYKTRLDTLLKSSDLREKRSFNPCTYAFVGEENAFNFNGASDLNENSSFVERTEANVPVVLEWAIGNRTCAEAATTSEFACQSNSMCVDSKSETGGYRCICKQGFEGNPYLFPGCQDINECKDVKKFPCYGTCSNTIGNYTCKCKRGYSGNAKVEDGCQHKAFTVLRVSLGIGLGFLILLIGLPYIVHLMVQNRKLKRIALFYEQNGGVQSEVKLKSFMTIYRLKDLEKATNKFAEDMVIGRGGNGTVYKGTLQNKCVVAIKKPLKPKHEQREAYQRQREAFTTEMIILAQLKHQNVVQLLGCCLETDVPLLVYEFVSNDTLHYHIRRSTRGEEILSWDNRLRIAHESASALAYLHAADDNRISIIHRDVKSTNILLDKNYTTKIADFGASRFVPLGHDEVTLLVQCTFGYLDPEFFHTQKLTDKSDVYSFGVVLAELLTGKKAVDEEREDRYLAAYFVKIMEEKRLNYILDRQVAEKATDMQLKAISDLVYRCLKQVGRNRPSMKEVANKLETLRKQGKQDPCITNKEKYKTIKNEEYGIDIVPLLANGDAIGK